MKIVILDGYTENPGDLSWEGLEKLGQLTVYDRTPLNDEDMAIERIGDAEAVYTNKTPITKKVIEACPNLKFIGVLATGYNVDRRSSRQRERAFPSATFQHTAPTLSVSLPSLFFLKSATISAIIPKLLKKADGSTTTTGASGITPLSSCYGKTMGVIGLGRIGQSTARIAGAMGMKVVAYDSIPVRSRQSSC